MSDDQFAKFAIQESIPEKQPDVQYILVCPRCGTAMAEEQFNQLREAVRSAACECGVYLIDYKAKKL
ncbi:unnamed protein product [marine sediment metagenome]|uniref:Transcription factor zinc-finger domain-containing protein n=1 Tax=marine sediment metagenome TaxID=412755 RepID=X0TNQ8_9ZZZZ